MCSSWWEESLNNAILTADRVAWLLEVLSLGDITMIGQLGVIAESVAAGIPARSLEDVARTLIMLHHGNPEGRFRSQEMRGLRLAECPTVALLLQPRFGPRYPRAIAAELYVTLKEKPESLLRTGSILRRAVGVVWPQIVQRLRESFEPDRELELLKPMRELISTWELQRRSLQLGVQPTLTVITAQNILEDAQAWPVEVIVAASTSLYAASAVTPLMDVAATERWFEEEA